MTEAGKRGEALDSFLRTYYACWPVNATFTGIHEHDDNLQDWSPDGLEHLLQTTRGIRARLREEALASRTSDQSLAVSFLDVQTAEIESRHFHRGNPSLHLGEAVFGVLGLMLRDFATPEERATHVVARLRRWTSFLKNIDHSISRQSVHTLWRERTLRECRGARELLGHGISAWAEAEGLPSALRAELAYAARMAGYALDTFSGRVVAGVVGDLTPACGPEILDLLLAEGHRIPHSRADLLDKARAELANAMDELGRMVRAIEPDGLGVVRERLADLHPSADDYLGTFGELWSACRSLAESKGFCRWPDCPIRYRRIPEWAKTAAPFLYFLHYRSPPPFDVLPAADYLVPNADDVHGLRATNTSVIKQNHVVHHGGLGHHVQNHYARRTDSLIGQVAAVDCATRIGMFCGGTMAEGWACYATDLMEEAGFFTPLEQVALQESRVKQLVRAVVDIELHQRSMNAEYAEQLFVQQASMTHSAARNEITKISMFPATGMMYWYGTKRIHDMRVEQTQRGTAPTSVRAFHDALLGHGSLPVDVIAHRMVGEQVV